MRESPASERPQPTGAIAEGCINRGKMAMNMGDNSSAITEAVDNTAPAVAPSASEGADSSDFVNTGNFLSSFLHVSACSRST